MTQPKAYSKPGYRVAQEAILSPQNLNPDLRSIVTVYVGDTPWSVAQEGKDRAMILAAPGGVAGTTRAPSLAEKHIVQHLTAAPVNEIKVPFSWFRDFCLEGEAPGQPNCQRCGEACPHCQGQGREGRNRLGQFASVVFNRWFFSLVLPYLEVEEVAVFTSQSILPRPDTLHVVCKDWHIVVMGVQLGNHNTKLENYIKSREAMEASGQPQDNSQMQDGELARLRQLLEEERKWSQRCLTERNLAQQQVADLADTEQLSLNLARSLALADVRLKPHHLWAVTECLQRMLGSGVEVKDAER